VNRTMQLLWLRLPLRVARLWPLLGVVLADGRYLVRWPVASVAMGPAALFFGVLVAGVQRLVTGPFDFVVFTASVVVVIVFAVIGQLAASIGLWAALGYSLVCVAVNIASGQTTDALHTAGLLAGSLDVVLVLVLLTSVIPVVVGGVRAAIRRLPDRVVAWCEPCGAAVAAAMAIWGWTSVAPLLIRPLYVWTVGAPTYEAMAPLQEQGIFVVFLGGIAATARVILERRALVGSTLWLSQVVTAGLVQVAARRANSVHRSVIRAVVAAAGITFFLAGVISNLVEAVGTLLFLSAVFVARHLLQNSPPAALGWLFRIPTIVRLVVGLLITWVLCQFIVGMLWNSTQSFLPVLAATCIGAAIITLITTNATVPRPVKEEVSS
jgi:hypothetical protein